MLLSIVPATLSWGAPLPECPPGTRAESRVLEDRRQRTNYCIDENTGLKEGLARYHELDGRLISDEQLRAGKPHGLAHLYDHEGRVLVEVRNEHGKVKASRVTLAGLRDMAEEHNAKAERDGKRVRLFVLDEQRLRYDYRTDLRGYLLPEDGGELRDHALADSQFCRLFRWLPQIQSVQVRYLVPTGGVQSSFEIARADCPESE